ncbi:MAG TPA: hypothetical protein VGM06_02945 [Polyangiaceae bacterium]
MDPTCLSYHLLRPTNVGAGDIPLLGEAYRCWSEVWTQTFAELDDADSLASDDFTRQSEIAALFHEWECVGTTSLRFIDVSNAIFRDDSYFNVWPEQVLAAASAHGPRICIASSFTVSPRWRRARGARIRDVLGALAVERFLRSDADALIGTVRNDVGMNAFTYKLGCHALARKLTLHGVDVDLIVFFRHSSARPPLEAIAEGIVQALRPFRGAP